MAKEPVKRIRARDADVSKIFEPTDVDWSTPDYVLEEKEKEHARLGIEPITRDEFMAAPHLGQVWVTVVNRQYLAVRNVDIDSLAVEINNAQRAPSNPSDVLKTIPRFLI